MRRRTCLALALAGGPALADDAPTGALQPRAFAPELALTGTDGHSAPLPAWLQGHATAVQLMFTACGTTCPTQGLMFSQLAARPRPRPVRWLSISIDALGDDAVRLAAWQRRIGAQPAWQVAVPAARDVPALVRFLRGAEVRADVHTTQVFVFDAAGRLAWRTGDLPRAAQIDALVGAV